MEKEPHEKYKMKLNKGDEILFGLSLILLGIGVMTVFIGKLLGF